MPKKPITDALKGKLDELDLERHLSELIAQAEDVVVRGVERAGELTHEHRDQIEGLLDRAGHAVDSRTEGRYADRLERLRSQLDRGVEKLAEQRRTDEAPPTDGPTTGDHPTDGPSTEGR